MALSGPIFCYLIDVTETLAKRSQLKFGACFNAVNDLVFFKHGASYLYLFISTEKGGNELLVLKAVEM